MYVIHKKEEMDINNPKYKKQGIHVEITVFTVDEKSVKILLVKRGKAPFEGDWILPGGAVYNDETINHAAARELKEKTGLSELYLSQFHAFGDPKRDPRMRMVSIGYLALIDKNKVNVLQKTPKTLDAMWFDINDLPKMAFDHRKIADFGIMVLRKKIVETNLVSQLMPKTFTMPELRSVYEALLGKELERRNFRKKFLKMGLVKPIGETKYEGRMRPAELYKFVDTEYKEIDVF